MPSLSPNPTIRRSEKYLISPAITALRVLLCLALAGCSAKDETVAPPQPQAPTIVAQPTVVVSDLGARITATVNPNGVDTECYFEYGPTATYGRQLPTKLIEAKLCDVVISDTVQNLGVDSTYHCRLVASNSAGTTQSTDKAFSVANAPPKIVSETSVSVTEPKAAVFTATVNANYRSTDCYFEYGQTLSYGMRTKSKSIGAAGSSSGVVVRDTIKGLSWDTTYHCRLVAENAAGKTIGSDQSFICSSAGWVDFVYPLEVGTRWWYRYYYYGYDWYRAHHRGSQLWEVVERISADSVRIQVSRSDTTIWGGSDSPPGEQSQVSFGASRTGDSYVVGWKDIIYNFLPRVLGDYFTVPRYVETGRDTVSLGYRNSYSECICLYVNGKGLVSYYYAHSPNSYVTETLTLDSVTVAP
jgi:hypothetical protein